MKYINDQTKKQKLMAGYWCNNMIMIKIMIVNYCSWYWKSTKQTKRTI